MPFTKFDVLCAQRLRHFDGAWASCLVTQTLVNDKVTPVWECLRDMDLTVQLTVQ